MVKKKCELNEADMRAALVYWVDAGCPDVGDVGGRVSLHHDQSDPREPWGGKFYASVSEKVGA